MKSRKSSLSRINPAVYREIEAWAQQEVRSVNGRIEYILQEAVRRRRGQQHVGDELPTRQRPEGGSGGEGAEG